MVIACSQVWINRVSLPILLVVDSWTGKIKISLFAFAPENLVSRDGVGSLVILRLNPVLTYVIPPEFRGGVHLFILNRHMPSGQFRIYRVTQLRADRVHCRESAGTRPVNLKVVPNGCYLGR